MNDGDKLHNTSAHTEGKPRNASNRMHAGRLGDSAYRGEAAAPSNAPEMQGRPGEGKHSGVRNVVGGGTQRNAQADIKRNAKERDLDVRFGAKGVMHQDIGESICLQPGNDCSHPV